MEQETKVLERHSDVLGKEGKFKYDGRTYYYDIPSMCSKIELYYDETKKNRVEDVTELYEYLLTSKGFTKTKSKSGLVIYTHPNDYFAFVQS